MISRTTARKIAELYLETFSVARRGGQSTYWVLAPEAVYDFLFDTGLAGWFCSAAKKTYSPTGTREFKEFLMLLHTGETLLPVTSGWDRQQRELLGQRYLKDLAQGILRRWERDVPGHDPHGVKPKVAELRALLELDGYRWDGGLLIPSEADVLDTREEAGVVEELFHRLGLQHESTAFHHLELAAEHYVAGRWDDSISNSRKFFESVLQEVAARHSEATTGSPIGPDVLERPVRVREYLTDKGLLEEKEKAAIASVYGLLSQTGGHPYMAQQEQARLMRHLALTFSQFVMLRLEGSVSALT